MAVTQTNASLRIAVVVSGQEGYGVGRFLQTQCEHASRHGLEIVYLHMDEGSVASELRALGANLVKLDCPAWTIEAQALVSNYLGWCLSGNGLRRAAREAAEAARDYRADCFYSHSLPGALVCGGAGRRAGIPAIGQYHGVLSRKRVFGLSRHALSWVLAAALDRIVCISRFAESTFAWPATRKLRLVYNGVDCESIEAAVEGAVQSPARCVCVGRLGPVKRVEVAIQAFGILRDRGVACELEVIGGPTEASNPYFCRLRDLVNALGLQRVVRFAGVLSPPYRRVAESAIFVHCTGKESFGLATVEAMSCGAAAVVPNTGGTNEVVEHESSGLTYPTGDAAALADAVERLLRDEPLRTRLAANGRRRARECFGIAAHMRAVRGVFEEVLAARGRASV